MDRITTPKTALT